MNREDSRRISPITLRDRDMHQLRARRQTTGHNAYAAIAGGLGALALLVWGNILRDTAEAPPDHPTRGYLAFLAAAVVLGVSAAAATATWMSTRVNQRLHAESDQLREYDNEQLVKNIARQVIATADEKKFATAVADEVTRQLNERDRAARQQYWESLCSDTGTGGPTGPLPQPRPSESGVVPFTRRPGGTRSSG